MAVKNDFLVNNYYPIDHFVLPGVDRVIFGRGNFWGSRQRYASVAEDHRNTYLPSELGGIPTTEYLELDLGRIREINYISFNIVNAPINVTIEYDSVSSDDNNHNWTEVTPLADMAFDDRIHYVAQKRNAWFHGQFYFTDSKMQMVHARYIRIGFQRRDVDWPTKNSKPFPWPIMVKTLRTARYMASVKDTIGLLFGGGTGDTLMQIPADPVNFNTTHIVKQQFTVPKDTPRGSIDPRLMGFGFLVEVKDLAAPIGGISIAESVRWAWELYDVSEDLTTPLLIKSGIETGAANIGRAWMDINFDLTALVETDRNNPRKYELSLRSLNAAVSDSIYLQTPADIPGITVDGSYTWTHGSAVVTAPTNVAAEVSSGDWIQKASGFDGPWKVLSTAWNGIQTSITLVQSFTGSSESGTGISKAQPFQYFDTNLNSFITTYYQSISLRMWADIGASGRDVLGNFYRYGTRYDKARQVVDGSKVGWTSAPQPSPEAVEALYFDMRSRNSSGAVTTSVIDAIRIAPRTPGIRMHVYYTEQNLNSVKEDGSYRTPQTNNEWDHMLWTPINTTYILRSNQTITLPTPIRASYIKLEFSRLQPLPFKAPQAPNLPPVEYRRYPTWIESQFDNALVRRVVEDWFIQNRTKVMVNVLKHMSDPIREFQYKEREFLAALALDKNVGKEARNSGLIDIKTNTFIDPTTSAKIFFQTKNMYQSSLVATVGRDSLLGQVIRDSYDPLIAGDPIEGQINASVGKSVPIVSSSVDRISESFSHLAQTPMWFNRVCRHNYKIEKGQYNQKAYFAGISFVDFLRRDYTVTSDDDLVVDNLEDMTNIEENSFIVQEVSRIAITLNQQIATGTPVTAYASYRVGDTPYLDEPVVFSDKTSAIPLIGRGLPAQNLMLTSAPGGQGIVYALGRDFDLVYSTDEETGDVINALTVFALPFQYTVIRQTNFQDTGLVLGHSLISGAEVYVPSAIHIIVDQGFAQGTAVITGSDTLAGQDISVVTGVAAPSGTETRGYTDAGTVTSVAVISGTDTYTPTGSFNYTDTGTVTGVAVPATVTEAQFRADAAVITSVGVISGTDIVTFADPTIATTDAVGGVAIRQGVAGADFTDTGGTNQFATYPRAKVMSVWIRWSTLQPNNPNEFNWNQVVAGQARTIDQSIDHAAANGYQIILRVSCGADAPAWLGNSAVAQSPPGTPKPVARFTAIGTDNVPKVITLPVFWDANLLFWYTALLKKINQQLSGRTSNNNVRGDYIYFMPVSMATELGTEIAMGYGKKITWLPAAPNTTANSAFLNAAFPATTLTGNVPITVPGGSPAYPAGNILIQIDNELMYVNHSGSTFTLNTNGRGWDNTAIADHTINSIVLYADTTSGGYFSDTANGLGKGASTPHEIATWNENAWLALGSLTSNRANIVQAWKNSIDAHMLWLDPLEVHPCVAIGSLFNDQYVGSQDIVQTMAIAYGSRLWVMTTNLQPGKDVSNNPTKVFAGVAQQTYYGGWSPYPANTMALAAQNGAVIGFQTAGADVFNTFANGFAGDTSAFRIILEEALALWAPSFIETSAEILNTNSPPATGTISTKEYLLGV